MFTDTPVVKITSVLVIEFWGETPRSESRCWRNSEKDNKNMMKKYGCCIYQN